MTQLAAGTPLLGGRFTVKSWLGGDDIATLYAITNVADGKPQLLELLTGPAALDEAAWQDCVRGAEVAATLPEAFAVLTESGTDHGFGRCLIREPLMGKNLADRLAAGPMSLPDLLALLDRLAPGLHRAHAAGVVHGGLTPSCVFTSPPGATPKLAELGVARLRQRRPSPWPVPLGWGAPEQVRGADALPVSDVYSLALIAFQAVTGHSYFGSLTADSPVDPEALWQEMLARPEPVTGLGEGLDRAFAAALCPDPGARTESIVTLAATLRASAGSAAAEPPGGTAAARPAPAAAPPRPRRAFGGTLFVPGGVPPPEQTARKEAPPQATPGLGRTVHLEADAASLDPGQAAPVARVASAAVIAPPAPAEPPITATAGDPTEAPNPAPHPETATARPTASLGAGSPQLAAVDAGGPTTGSVVAKAGGSRGLPLRWIVAAAAAFFLIGAAGVAAALVLYLHLDQRPSEPTPATVTPEPSPLVAATAGDGADGDADGPPGATAGPPASASSVIAPEPAFVTFACTPACESIECDGVRSDAPADPIQLRPGEHQCRLARAGHVTHEERLHLDAGAHETRRITLLAEPPTPSPARPTSATAAPDAPKAPPKTRKAPTSSGKCGTFINPCKK